MAYTSDEYTCVASGTLAGGEVWYNTWCARRIDSGALVADLIAGVQAFYADFAALDVANDWTLQTIQAKNLSSEIVTNSPVNPAGAGSDSTNPPLPNQVATRVSLKGLPNVNGGPFLVGWSSAALSTDGDLEATNKAGLVTAVTDLQADLLSNDWVLSILRPTIESTVTADSARIGERFDIIRRRANERLEAYSTIAF